MFILLHAGLKYGDIILNILENGDEIMIIEIDKLVRILGERYVFLYTSC